MSTDAELLIGARRRDRDCVAALYDRHAARMYAVARRVTGDDAVAADVLEDVFLSICNGGVVLDGSRSAEAWLIRLARDRALARETTRQTQTALPSVDTVGAPSPRALVEAAFYGNLTVSALAERYVIPEETVRALLRDGMVALRKQLGGKE